MKSAAGSYTASGRIPFGFMPTSAKKLHTFLPNRVFPLFKEHQSCDFVNVCCYWCVRVRVRWFGDGTGALWRCSPAWSRMPRRRRFLEQRSRSRTIETGAVRTTASGADGSFRILDLDPGRYTVTVELSGFQKVQADDVLVLLGRTVEFPGAVEDWRGHRNRECHRRGRRAIDLTSTTIAHNVTAEEFDRMPKARTFQDVALAAPSVNQGQIEGGLQVNGASGAENAYTVDGVVTNSLVNGGVAAERRVRIPPGSAGQDHRDLRGIRRGARRRRERRHQVGGQHVPGRGPLLLLRQRAERQLR